MFQHRVRASSHLSQCSTVYACMCWSSFLCMCLWIFFCRLVMVLLLGVTTHGSTGGARLTTASWDLWRTKNNAVTPYYESPSTVHLHSTTTMDAVNGTSSLVDKTVLSLLLSWPVFTQVIVMHLVLGTELQQKLVVFVMPRLAANCHQETFKFLFTSRMVFPTLAMHLLAPMLASGQVTCL